MGLIDNLFQLELFSVPIWKRAEKSIKQKDIATFKKRWPVWAKRLEFFPSMRAELFSQIFKEDSLKELTPSQREILEIFFEHSTIKSNDVFVATTLSQLCLKHNWSALEEIEKYIPFNTQTRTIVACAMLHEANDSFWDTILNRPRISLQESLKYIKSSTSPYSLLNDIYEKSLFYFKPNTYDITSFSYMTVKHSSFSVLPNFNQNSLWEYAMTAVSDPNCIQKITEFYPLPFDQLAPIFQRKYQLNSNFLYNLIEKNMPLCETLNSLLIKPIQTGIDLTNVVEVVKETTPAIAPAFKEAVEQYLNEKQRDKLLESLEASNHCVRRKM